MKLEGSLAEEDFPALLIAVRAQGGGVITVSQGDAVRCVVMRDRKLVSVAMGLLALAAAVAIDRRTREDFAFWFYLFGPMAFWGGLSLLDSGSELGKFIYALVNLLLLAAGRLLKRRAFLAFGAIGLYLYLGHLALCSKTSCCSASGCRGWA